ncbi:hypothetical protein Trydic_g1256 [Trypoxylus dichotomus]
MMNLLTLVVVLFLGKAAEAELRPAANLTLETAHYTCLLGSGIELNAIKNSLNGSYSDDRQLAQYFQCMFRMYSLLDIQGNLKNDTIFDAIHSLEKDHSYTEEGVLICQNETLYMNVTQNEIAYEFFKCFRNYTEHAYYWSILKYLLSKQQDIYAALTPTQSLKLETVHYTCAMGSDVQLQPIKDSLNGIYSNDSRLEQYFECVFRMYGYIDKNGNLKNETMFNSIPTDDKDKLYTENAIKTCQHKRYRRSRILGYSGRALE